MIVDTSVLYAYFVCADPSHGAATTVIEGRESDEELVVSPLVIAELDYLIATRFGVAAELLALQELAGGAWNLAAFDAEDLAAATSIVEKYSDYAIGVTDASLVVLAGRHRTRTIGTLDRRHFEALRSIDGNPFRLVP